MAKAVRVGFVGIGAMGWHMATNLAKAGFEVTVADADRSLVERFARKRGGRGAVSLADLGKSSDVIVTMLPTGAIVRHVLLEAEDGALARSLRKGAVVVDMSSSEPTGTRALCAELAARGVRLVDAPVSGGVAGAEAARLTIMIGSDDERAVKKVAPVLAALGTRHFRTGACGSGHALKALNNMMAGTGFIIMVEALLIGRKFGLDPELMIDVINESTGRNFATGALGRQEVISRNFGSHFMLGLLAKDVKIAADLAEDLGMNAPMTRMARDLWLRAREVVGPDEDHTCAVKYWEGLNGVTVEAARKPRSARGRG